MPNAALRSRTILIIGGGIGGLSASIRLAQLGYQVQILEARGSAGGLASGVCAGDFAFDAGPYILLDKPGLDWALQQLGIAPETLPLTPIEAVYHVLHEDGSTTAFDRSLAATAARFEAAHPGSGAQYTALVDRTFAIHQNLKPFTFKTHPNVLDVLRNGSLRYVPFLLSSLDTVLKQSGLPLPLRKGISIWTHVAGQPVEQAPSPMAFVPGLFHRIGAYHPRGGMRAIATLLEERALAAGVTIRYHTKVAAIRTASKAVTGVQTEAGEFIPAEAVISNSNGIGTYTELVENFAPPEKAKLEKLPLQSPGVCVYLAVQGRNPPYYIRFKLNGTGCTAFVQPGLLDPGLAQDGWYPARLIAPLDHATAAELGSEGQHQLMDELLADPWWRENITAYRVLHRRTTFEWGREYTLYHDSMNPVMTARFMIKGRIAHRSPFVRGLYLTGSSTHPGQWVSFCAISGVLAADSLAHDYPVAHA
ncbi:phytoene desaturase family protein [Hymenobacter arizonensis]|uniref:Phytoene dehydrogenase-related protein n=1 Tax=Hymenobacter arizonensis TaxID=1227077 RepID=A0A1I5XIW3_HYMAR|nr:NAD(P)/FAD-dependent oxidoreductase [Hymenobacter arizonensis]SFQ31891.1 Phytoene dehydrogenase-related protein [Hymenobacter arizonensis]